MHLRPRCPVSGRAAMTHSKDWEEDCLKYRGEVLTGRYGHFCPDWDSLPIDETCVEWPCCDFEPEGITEEQKAEARAINDKVQEEFKAACEAAHREGEQP